MKQFLLTMAVLFTVFSTTTAQKVSPASGLETGTTSSSAHSWSLTTSPTVASYATNKGEATSILRNVPGTTVASPLSDACATATDINALFTGAFDVPQTSDLQDNTGATADGDPPVTETCFFEDDPYQATLWFTFTGTDGIYNIQSVSCDATNPLTDTQFALYSGDDCDNLTIIACNDDIDGGGGNFLSVLDGVMTESGVTYYLLVDGYNGGVGEFCLEVTQTELTTCEEIAVGEPTLVDAENVFCFGESVTVTLADGTVIVNPATGFSGFGWLVHTEDPSGVDNAFGAPGLLGLFGPTTEPFDLDFTNDPEISNIPVGTYYFTPVSYDNATNNDGTFSGFTFEDGCLATGASIEIILTGDADPDDISVSTTTLIEEGDNNDTLATVTLITTGGTGDLTYLWSTGDTTTVVDSLAEGTYTVTISDPSPCVNDEVVIIVVDFNPPADDNNFCSGATDISDLFTGEVDMPEISTIFTNVDATAEGDDDISTSCHNGNGADDLQNTVWFSFDLTEEGIYDIIAINCDGITTYNDDTQFLLFSGNDCNNLTEIACNEDLSADDFSAALSGLVLAPGQYYLLVDGWQSAEGEFCLEVTEREITCEDNLVPTGTAENTTVCLADTLRITMSGETMILQDGIAGFRWLIHDTDPSALDNPFEGFFASFAESTGSYGITYVHTGEAPLTPSIYYFTPVVYSNATDVDGMANTLDYIFDDGCVLAGETLEITLLPASDAISAEVTSEPEEEDVSLGSATVTATGGFQNELTYEWSNGEMTATINGLMAGEYSVTVTDPNGCVDPVVEMVSVGFISDVNDSELNAAVQLFPNPAKDLATFRYDFTAPVDLSIQLTNTLGQTLINRQLGNATQGSEALDISNLAPGTYFVRYTDGNRQAVKPLVIVR